MGYLRTLLLFFLRIGSCSKSTLPALIHGVFSRSFHAFVTAAPFSFLLADWPIFITFGSGTTHP